MTPRRPRRDADMLYRAKWTQAAREAYFKEHPENFAGPDMSYPIRDASDVNDAARLAGHAADPAAVRRKIIEIAKRLGFGDALPDSWKDNMPKKPQTTMRAAPPVGVDPVDGNDDGDRDGTHTDGRSADELLDELTDNASPDDDEEDEADSLTPGAVGGRAASPAIERTTPAPDVHYYAPITRIDREKREVIGVATAEVKDAYRTVIGYEASKDAFARWRGNIREMHDPKKAVGRALEIMPDDEHRRIIVRAKVSKGAEDTWQKVLDGTLTGFSIGGRNGVWTEREVDGETLPYLDRYDQVELSLVDNPACPASTIEVVRADGVASDVLASDSEVVEAAKPAPAVPTVERAGARLSKETMDAMHMARDHAMNAAKQSMMTCGCDDCSDMLNQISAHDDNDGDMDANYLTSASLRAAMADIVRAELSDALRSQVAPTMQRVNALLASDAQRQESVQPELTRRVDELADQLKAIHELVEQIAAQPVGDGPVLHGMEKHLATHSGNASRATDSDAIRRAMELGFAPPSDMNDAIRAAASLVRPIGR